MTTTPDPVACSYCGTRPTPPKRLAIGSNGMALCQGCVESALREFRTGKVRLAGLLPWPEEAVCLLCDRPEAAGTFNVFDPKRGMVCSSCIEEYYRLVVERRVGNASPSGSTASPPAAARRALLAHVDSSVLTVVERDVLRRYGELSLADDLGSHFSPEEFAVLKRVVALLDATVQTVYAPHAAQAKRALEEDVNRELSREAMASVVLSAMPLLVAPLGPGSAQELMTSFLKDLAATATHTGVLEARGTLAELFQRQLREPSINPTASDPTMDEAFITSLIRPTLSRLRQLGGFTRVEHGGIVFRVHLVLGDPKKPRGPVKQVFRVAALLVQDHAASLMLPTLRPRLIALLEELVDTTGFAARLNADRLAPLDRIVDRILADTEDISATDRARLRLVAILALLAELLCVVTDDEKAQLLSGVLGLTLRDGPPIAALTQSFDDWFLGAVRFRSGGSDPSADRAFSDALRQCSALSFSEKLVFAALYDLGAEDTPLRGRLIEAFSRLTAFGSSAITPLPDGGLRRVLERRRASNYDDFAAILEHRVKATVRVRLAASRRTLPTWLWLERPL